MKNLATRLLTMLVVIAMLLSACAFAEDAPTDNIVVLLSTDIDSFNPENGGNVINSLLLEQVYDRLFENNQDMLPEPMLAKDTVYESDTSVLITIHEGVKFTDGSDLTAEDVQFSLMHAKDTPVMQSLMASVENVEVVDTYTIRITLNSMFPSLKTALAHTGCSILPKEYLEEVMVSGDWSAPIGSGRYILKERVISDRIVFERNPNYWNVEDAAKNATLTFKVIPEGSTRLAMLEKGEADLNIEFSTSDYERVTSNKDLALHEYASNTTAAVWLDVRNSVLSDKRVRQALNYAVDRDAIVLGGVDGLASPLYTYVGPGCIGYSENPGGYSYDPEKAMQLLAEAGYPNGFTLDMYYPDRMDTRPAEVFQAYMMQIGVTVNLAPVDTNLIVSEAGAGQLPMILATWGCYADPDLFMTRIFTEAGFDGWNIPHYNSEELNALIEKGRSTLVESERAEFYAQAQAVLAEDCPWVPLYIPTMFAVSRAGLQGVSVTAELVTYMHLLHY